MINVSVLTNNNRINGFELSGHAEYSEYGEDIVCAAISILTINTINSIETFTDDIVECLDDEQKGYISFKILDGFSDESNLLLKSMVLGIESIAKEYGSDYINLIFKEV